MPAYTKYSVIISLKKITSKTTDMGEKVARERMFRNSSLLTTTAGLAPHIPHTYAAWLGKRVTHSPMAVIRQS